MRFLSFSLIFAGATTAAFAFDYDGTPRGTAYGYAETAGIITQRIFEQWRPTSIVPETPGSLTTKYRVVYVKDTSISNVTVRFAFDQSPAQLNTLRGQGWRIEDLVVLRGGSEPRLAGLLRKYSTPKPETFWFHNYRADQVDALANSGNRVLELDLDGVVDGHQKFAGVMVKNTGADHKGWGWMPDHTAKQINDWAGQNGMRVIDLLEKPNGKFAAAMVKWDAAGGRSENFILSGSQLPELLSARGMRLQTLNILPGSNWHTGVIVNNVNAQSARMADYLAANTQGQIGAFLSRIGGEVIVNLRGDRPFYPCSAIKVLIHVHGISRVPAADLNRYTIDNVLLRTWASKMMMDSDNPSTYKLNKHWGTDKINAYGRSHLGMTSATYIKDHYGIAPPDGKENAWATLVDMANLYSKLGVVGAERQDELKSWMLNDTNSGMFDGEFSAARQKLGLNSTQYSTWRQKVKFQFKAGNLVHPNDSKSSSDFVVNGKIMLPYRIGSMAQLRSYAFGYFVNKSPQPYKSDVAWKAASMLLREQIEDSMKTYK